MKERRNFDEPFALAVEAALRGLAPDAAPKWGSLTRQDLLEHLLAALRYSLGEIPFDVPRQTSPWRGRILRWLILDVGVPMPRNVRFRGYDGDFVPLARVTGGIPELREALLKVARAGVRDVPAPASHPYFGPLTLDQWKRFHVRHIGHHLRQFGLSIE